MFDTIKIRLRHEKRHKEGDNFACQECDRKFTNEKNLAHHLKHHHNTAEKPEIKADEIAEEPKPKKRKRTKKTEPTESNKKDAHKMHPCHLCTVCYFHEKIPSTFGIDQFSL